MRHFRLPLLVALVALSTTACFSHQSRQPAGPQVGDQTARVDVRNNNWLDMAIYAQRGGMRVRIGTVTSMGSEMLTIPRNILASVNSISLVASPIGATYDYTSYPVNVWPGDTVEFTIQNNVGTSTITNW